MRHFGQYEPVVEQALNHLGPGPWSLQDLSECESWIGDEQCRQVYPHCHPGDVIDWLHTFSSADREELIQHLNSERAKRG